jgi:hypothetical protein
MGLTLFLVMPLAQSFLLVAVGVAPTTPTSLFILALVGVLAAGGLQREF